MMVYISGSRGTLARSLVAMVQEADRRWPGRSTVSDGSIGDADHAARESDHNPKSPNPPGWIDALDLTHDPVHGVDNFVNSEQLRLRRDPRIKYCIFSGRIFKSYVDSAGRPAWAWQPYTGTNAHEHHMHTSVTPEGRDDTRPWFSEEDDMTDEEHFWLQELHARKGTIDALAVMVADTQAHVKDVVEEYLADLAALPASGGGTVDVAALGKAIAVDIAKRLEA